MCNYNQRLSPIALLSSNRENPLLVHLLNPTACAADSLGVCAITPRYIIFVLHFWYPFVLRFDSTFEAVKVVAMGELSSTFGRLFDMFREILCFYLAFQNPLKMLVPHGMKT